MINWLKNTGGSMEVLNMINEIEEMIESSKSIFGNKATIDKARALELITDIRISLPDDFKQAEWISQERQRIMIDAEEDAKEILEKANIEAKRLVQEHTITQSAYKKAQEIIERAESDARELRNGAIFYSQDLMKNIAIDMNEIAKKVMKNHDELGAMVVETEEDNIEE